MIKRRQRTGTSLYSAITPFKPSRLYFLRVPSALEISHSPPRSDVISPSVLAFLRPSSPFTSSLSSGPAANLPTVICSASCICLFSVSHLLCLCLFSASRQPLIANRLTVTCTNSARPQQHVPRVCCCSGLPASGVSSYYLCLCSFSSVSSSSPPPVSLPTVRHARTCVVPEGKRPTMHLSDLPVSLRPVVLADQLLSNPAATTTTSCHSFTAEQDFS